METNTQDGANSLYTKEEIIRNKEVILPALYDWAQTFEEDDELDSFTIIIELLDRLRKNICSDEDYEDINSHIYQIDYNYYTSSNLNELPFIQMDCLLKPFNMENKFFYINGYFKDDKTEFENYLVSVFDGLDEESSDFNDEDIFFYGLSEEEIIEAIENPFIQNNLEFVITSYSTEPM